MRVANVVMALTLAVAAAPAHGRAATADAASSNEATRDTGSLAATTAVPWNPPHAIARRQAWERVVLFPERVVSLPLSGLGLLADRGLLRAEDMGYVPTAPTPGSSRGSDFGVAIGPPGLGGRSGVGASARVHEPVLAGNRKLTLSARYAGTIRDYNGTTIAVSGDPLSLQYGVDWRPQEPFYGVGAGSARGNLGDYALHDEYVRLSATRASRPFDANRAGGMQAGAWIEARNDVLSSGRWRGVTSYEDLFPDVGAQTLGRRVEHLVYGASLSTDRRVGGSHWSQGWRAQVSAERHDDPVQALALRSAMPRGVAFDRFHAEAETGFSFMRDPRTVRLMARLVDQAGADRDRMLPSDLATLGGAAGLPGFATGRFHDMDLLLARASYLYPIGRRLEMELHSEWGAVYPDVWRDARLAGLEHSVGVSLRTRYISMPLAAVGVDWSREGPRLTYAMGNLR